MTRSPGGAREAGFTVIELIVVLALLAFAYALVAPSVAGLLDGPRFDGAVREVIIALREARATAITKSRSVEFMVAGDRRSWRSNGHAGTVADGVNLILEGRAASPEIVFFPDGSSTGGLVSLTSGARTRVVAVDWVSGRITERPE